MSESEIFEQLDTDHDGLISLEEFKAGISVHGKKPSASEAEALFHNADSNSDGHIDKEEFHKLWTSGDLD